MRTSRVLNIGLCVVSSIAGSIALGALCLSRVEAQNWPSRAIEMIIPFTAGGGTDIVGRSVAASLSDQLGQNVVVVNREGAAGTLAYAAVASAKADGYTIAFGPTTPIVSAPYLIKGVRYQTESFDYICRVFDNVFAIAVRADSKFQSARDLVAAAAENSGQLTYGHAGTGTVPNLSVESFARSLHLKVTGVPFRGDNSVLPVLLKGDLDFAALGLSTIRGQNVRVLAVFSDKRHVNFSDVPTVGELGVARSVPPGHNGIIAPKGLPAEIRASLERGCATAAASKRVIDAIEKSGQAVGYATGDRFHAETAEDYKFSGELVHQLGLGTP